MSNEEIIAKTAEMIKDKFLNEGSGHDFWHIWRVWQVAKRISMEEHSDGFVVELGALLHDVADWKENYGDASVGGKVARGWLEKFDIDSKVVNKVVEIVDNVSFKGAGVNDKMDSLEGKIVQDADRLDAMGAIGIGRVFSYGGSKGRAMYDPDNKIIDATNFEQYKNAGQTSVNHFYEKLLLLKDRMHTQTGKKLAQDRHVYMEKYLDEFYAEWKGEK